MENIFLISDTKKSIGGYLFVEAFKLSTMFTIFVWRKDLMILSTPQKTLNPTTLQQCYPHKNEFLNHFSLFLQSSYKRVIQLYDLSY